MPKNKSIVSLNQPLRLESKDYIRPGHHIHIKIDQETLDWPLHWHDYFEIEIVINASGQYLLNETTYDVSRYNAFFLTPIDFHQLSFDYPTKIICISFDKSALSDYYLSTIVSPNMKHAFCLTAEEQERILMATTLLIHECETGGNCQNHLFEYILECLLKNGACQPLHNDYEHLPRIEKVILYMETHFREKITLPLLAEQAGFHPNYFSELFKKVTGQTYVDKLNQLRVDYACVLLRNGFSVSDACFSSGFGSLSNFLSTFKARRGISPNEYKKRHIQK